MKGCVGLYGLLREVDCRITASEMKAEGNYYSASIVILYVVAMELMIHLAYSIEPRTIHKQAFSELESQTPCPPCKYIHAA